jgi:uncharacterized protein (UPF0548 family)
VKKVELIKGTERFRVRCTIEKKVVLENVSEDEIARYFEGIALDRARTSAALLCAEARREESH